MADKVKITETVLRDAHQSLHATRMSIKNMEPILEKLDKVGYYSLEMWGGATFDSCVRYLGEDPWERITKIKEKVKNTKLQMLLRGQNLVGYKHYPDDLVEKFVKHAAERGIDVFRIFDALNDVRNMKKAIEEVKKNNKIAEGAISYTTSPVHTNEKYAELATQLQDLGCDLICIKDMAGLLSPKNAYELVTMLKKTVKIPIHLHAHYTSGMASSAYLAGCQAGADIIDCAVTSMAFGTSQPGTETMVASLAGYPFETGLNIKEIAEISKYFKKIRETSLSPFESPATGVNVDVLVNQIPGGMISNLANQLKSQGILDKMEEILQEVVQVRKDLGYPPLVTPTSQIVGSQAVFNVVMGERYKNILDETKEYLKGMYGKPAGEIDEELRNKALGDEKKIDCRPADLIKPGFDKYKKESEDFAQSEEDILTYALFPQIAEKFLKAKYNNTLHEVKEKPFGIPKSVDDMKKHKLFVKVAENEYEVEVFE
ncbi:MAG: pyruvate carboxylase subunit B [Candidatus Muiribacteriota bacterium]